MYKEGKKDIIAIHVQFAKLCIGTQDKHIFFITIILKYLIFIQLWWVKKIKSFKLIQIISFIQKFPFLIRTTMSKFLDNCLVQLYSADIKY